MPSHSVLRRAVLALLTLALLLGAPRRADAVTIPIADPLAVVFVGEAAQGPYDTPTEVLDWFDFSNKFGSSTVGLARPYLSPSVAAFFINGGLRLYIVRVHDSSDAAYIGVDGGVPGARTGMQAARDVDDAVAVSVVGQTSLVVQQALITMCEQSGDRIALLDSQSQTDIPSVLAQRAALSSPDGWAALYFPWVQSVALGPAVTLPPSVFAGAIVSASEPQQPQTGRIVQVTGLTTNVNSTQDATLNAQNVDAIRVFAGPTYQVWGARTLATSTDWTYISVRREALAIVKSVLQGTTWSLSQPNDETLWTQLTSDVNDLLHQLFLYGWFKGTSPSQAYLVHCDATTMTPQDIAEGRTNILIGFAPLRPAEFVLVHVTLQHTVTADVGASGAATLLAAPRPSPASQASALDLTLARPARVTLQVLDVAGRVVRTLAASEALPAGRHTRTWDLRDDAGVRVPAGLYLARISLPEHAAQVRRLVVVR